MKRNLNIEAFRSILMFLIVVHHAFIRGIWAYDSQFYSLAFTSLIAWHVDSFVAISGWYGIRFSWTKFFYLWAQMAFYTLLNVGLLHFVFHERVVLSDFVVHGGWFGESYLALMLVAPFINAGVEKLSSMGGRKEMCLLVILITLNWVPFHAMSGVAPKGYDPCSFITLALMYTIVRFLRNKFEQPVSMRKLGVCIILFICAVTIIGFGKTIVDGVRSGWNLTPAPFIWLTHHNAPHVMLMAITMFMLFVWHVQLPGWLLRISAFLAPSMFGIYLMYEGTICGQRLICAIQYQVKTVLQIHPIFTIVTSAILVFIICLAIDLLRRVLFAIVCRVANLFGVRNSMPANLPRIPCSCSR